MNGRSIFLSQRTVTQMIVPCVAQFIVHNNTQQIQNTMLTYKNDPKIKESLIKRMDSHIIADELLQGATGQDGKGCTVWCALNNGDLKEGYNHSAFETILGLPEWLAELQDRIFEGLIVEDAKWFSSEWPKAIPVGKNIEPVKWKFCAFIMKENIERVLLLDISEELKKEVVNAINGVLSLHETAAKTGVWDESAAWSAARSAARSAAYKKYAIHLLDLLRNI